MSSKSSQIICLVALSAVVASAQTLTYSNGPLITHPGAGLAGADASALETGGTVFGFTAGPANFRQADDFVVPCNEQWAIVGFRAFAYQTNSGIVSTLTSSNYRIWSGQPGTPGAVVIHDFSATNQQTATAFTNIYRVTPTTLTGNTRPIFSTTMAGNSIVLDPGTYWFDFQIAGSGALGGPFSPPISGTGTVPPVGNGIQSQLISTGFFWNGGNPSGTGVAAVLTGLPFEIDYQTVTGPTCYTYTFSQPVAGGPITITNAGGLPGHLYLNPITFNQGVFPNGWLSGVDIPLGELFNQIPLGAPFFGVLDGTGGATFVVPGGLFPAGITIYTASNFYAGLGSLGEVSAFAFTTI